MGPAGPRSLSDFQPVLMSLEIRFQDQLAVVIFVPFGVDQAVSYILHVFADVLWFDRFTRGFLASLLSAHVGYRILPLLCKTL